MSAPNTHFKPGDRVKMYGHAVQRDRIGTVTTTYAGNLVGWVFVRFDGFLRDTLVQITRLEVVS